MLLVRFFEISFGNSSLLMWCESYCGISVSLDGSEDGEIHFLKDGGVAAQARADIQQETAAILGPQLEVHKDSLLIYQRMKTSWKKIKS